MTTLKVYYVHNDELLAMEARETEKTIVLAERVSAFGYAKVIPKDRVFRTAKEACECNLHYYEQSLKNAHERIDWCERKLAAARSLLAIQEDKSSAIAKAEGITA